VRGGETGSQKKTPEGTSEEHDVRDSNKKIRKESFSCFSSFANIWIFRINRKHCENVSSKYECNSKKYGTD